MKTLKHKANGLITQFGQPTIALAVDFLAIKVQFTFTDLIQQTNHVEQGALAATRGTHDR